MSDNLIKINLSEGAAGVRPTTILMVNQLCNELLVEQNISPKSIWVVLGGNLSRWTRDQPITAEHHSNFRNFLMRVGRPMGALNNAEQDKIRPQINALFRQLREKGAAWKDLFMAVALNMRGIMELAKCSEKDCRDFDIDVFIIGSQICPVRGTSPEEWTKIAV